MEKILVFGGTQFVGKTIVEKLSNMDQYDLTLFNRGKTNNDAFQHLAQIKGDRNTNDIEQIGSQSWDYVIDVSCYYPASLKKVLASIGKVKRYVFISTCSVYDNEKFKSQFRNEDAPILPCSEAEMTDESPASYGQRKAECERILAQSGIDHAILRPALVYGPQDYTDRLYYWLYQVKHHDTLLLPNKGESKFSLTYVEDLAQLVKDSLSTVAPNNTYTATSHPGSSIKSIVESAARALGKQPTVVNASPTFLHEQGIAQWTEIPLWLDTNDFTYDNSKVKEAMSFSPSSFDASIRATINYFDHLGWPVPTFGMGEEKRKALLAKVKAEA